MEFLSLALLGVLIVISPGADFVLVFKKSVSKGRKAGILTSLGIATGVCIHVGYSIVGIGHLISQNELLFSIVKYAGAGYLIYLGLMGIFKSNIELNLDENVDRNLDQSLDQKKKLLVSTLVPSINYFIQGFLCNLLNPKTMLFFLSVFSQLVSSDNNLLFILSYGIYIVILHGVWFFIISMFVTSHGLLKVLQRYSKQINQVCGAGLIVFGTLLTLSR